MRACRLMELHRSTCRHQSRKEDGRALRMRLKELACSRPRYGCRRLTVLLQREGRAVVRTRTHRIHGEEGLLAPMKHRRTRAARRRLRQLPAEPDEHWSIDSMRDQLADGRRFRVLTPIDHVR
jgi:putative transposase